MDASDVIALLAVIIATLSLGWSWWNGRTLAHIDRREHEWQAVDRTSAHVEVTRHRIVESSRAADGRRYVESEHWLRLKNTGRAPAIDVDYGLWTDGERDRSVLQRSPGRLDILHPGEWFDVWLVLTLGTGVVGEIRVEWTDDHGRHEKRSAVNL